MIDAKVLLADLQKLLGSLEDDIRARCESNADVDAPLRKQYAAAKGANRTAQAYEVWRDEQITQAAVAWILGCVFVRFCEDNQLIDPPRLAGPDERLRRAEDEHTLYFRTNPSHSDREYLYWVFKEVAKLPAMRELFDERHNPLWSLGLSGDGAMKLREFWQKRDPATGTLVHDFTHPAFVPAAGDASDAPHADPTRFLGDLYQDLSESARKRFALLQTPIFVEEFILDRTLEPAIREFGYQQVRMIDPTCGSGHFLLGGFRRLFDLWVKHEPATNVRELAQRALNQVYGVDLNPYAIAIARFRLLVAALRACEIRRLADAPGFTINLAAGDSLLHGPRPDAIDGHQLYLTGKDPLAHVYEIEDAPLLQRYLGQQYHAVVGNPPYITPKDKALNDAYRDRFGSCHMKYSLAVPFFQRFFDLAVNDDAAGFVGMITANSFMKREFGKKLIEQYIPRWNITHVIDSSGAYIPGHNGQRGGTPTAILFGRNRRPVESTVRTVMGIKGEPGVPAQPARGEVWSAILTQINQPGSASEYVSVTDLPRESFHRHPWSIGGGGAAELKEILDGRAKRTLGAIAQSIGYSAIVGDDDAYVAPSARCWQRMGVTTSIKPFAVGDSIRDWAARGLPHALYPYDDKGRYQPIPAAESHFWSLRGILRSGQFYGQTKEERGLNWRQYAIVVQDKLFRSEWILYAFISTHAQFIFDRTGLVSNKSAPGVKLPLEAGENDHLGLLGLLNSSVACFWGRQTFFPKGGYAGGKWEERLEWDGTKLQQFPLPDDRPLSLATRLDQLAQQLVRDQEARWNGGDTPTSASLAAQQEVSEKLFGEMVSLQDELDWECYQLYGLLGSAPRHHSPPPIRVGQRAFEIVLARQMAAGEIETTWFERHGAVPITEIPAEWPEDYQRVVRNRIEIIESEPRIALIEQPEYKRRWNTDPWEVTKERVLRSWLLDRLEGWPHREETSGLRSVAWDEHEPRLMSVAQLADRVRQDKNFMEVASLYRSRDDFDVTKLVAELVEDEAVPFLPVLRYKDSGLRNRRVWEQVWDLQRQEDAIDARTKLPKDHPQHLTEDQAKAEKKRTVGDIPVPPKYKSADMLNGTIWRLRGKLDVPKERFVSFPHCQRDADPTLVITWAGFDHLQQMQALAAYYMDVKEREGWSAERRLPLLAGMLELLPWVLQWHNEVDPTHQLRMGDYYRDFIDDEAREVGKTLEQIRAWAPPAKAAGRKKKVTA